MTIVSWSGFSGRFGIGLSRFHLLPITAPYVLLDAHVVNDPTRPAARPFGNKGKIKN